MKITTGPKGCRRGIRAYLQSHIPIQKPFTPQDMSTPEWSQAAVYDALLRMAQDGLIKKVRSGVRGRGGVPPKYQAL